MAWAGYNRRRDQQLRERGADSMTDEALQSAGPGPGEDVASPPTLSAPPGSAQPTSPSVSLKHLAGFAGGTRHELGNLLLPLRMRIDSLTRQDLPERAERDVQALAASMANIQEFCASLRLLVADGDEEERVAIDPAEWWRRVRVLLKLLLPTGVRVESVLSDESTGRAVCAPAALATSCVEAALQWNDRSDSGDALHGRLSMEGNEFLIQLIAGESDNPSEVLFAARLPRREMTRGATTHSGVDRAYILLEDPRLQRAAGVVAETLGAEVCYHDAECDDRPAVWVVESRDRPRLDSVIKRRQQGIADQCIAFGEHHPNSNAPGLVRVSADEGTRGLRSTLQRLMRSEL